MHNRHFGRRGAVLGGSGVSLSKGKLLLFRGFVLLLLAGTLLAAEWMARRLYDRITPASGRRAVETLLGEDAAATGYFVQHPYLFYAYRPGYAALGYTQFNANGYRGREIPLAKDPDVLRVLAVGGSTTVSFPYLPNPEDAWPAQLERLLAERTGARVEVINAGLHAATSAEHLAHYTFRDRYFKPDIVVLHVGGNDGLGLHFPGYNPEYTNFTHGWRATAMAPRPGERTLLRSALVRVAYAYWLRAISLEATIGREVLTRVEPAAALRNVEATEPTGFRRNLDLLLRTMIADGAQPVLFPFVHAPEARMREDRTYGRWTTSMLLAFAKDRAVVEEAARARNLPLVDVPDGAIAAGSFRDFCHVDLAGERVKAERVADALVPLVRRWQQRAAAAPAGAPR
jgi:lysophospholipase L1-like esterase